MRKLVWLFVIAACFWPNSVNPAPPPTLAVMTLNVRYDNPEDGVFRWKYRKNVLAEVVRTHDVDLLGTQEVLHGQLLDLQKLLPEYETIGVGRDDGKKKGEYAALWYKVNRFSLLDSGYFWLSETPQLPGSVGWDAACPRMAVWALLQDKIDGRRFFFLNTHLDHVGNLAQLEGVNLILEKTAQVASSLPIIVTGDFNVESDSPVFRHFTDSSNVIRIEDARTLAPLRRGSSWSFHDFGRLPVQERPLLDHICVSPDFQVLTYEVLPAKVNDIYVSDHSPVMVTLH